MSEVFKIQPNLAHSRGDTGLGLPNHPNEEKVSTLFQYSAGLKVLMGEKKS